MFLHAVLSVVPICVALAWLSQRKDPVHILVVVFCLSLIYAMTVLAWLNSRRWSLAQRFRGFAFSGVLATIYTFVAGCLMSVEVLASIAPPILALLCSYYILTFHGEVCSWQRTN